MVLPLHSILSEILSLLDIHDPEVSSPISGCSHDVYILRVLNGRRWTLRIAKDEFAALLASRSVPLMRYIKLWQPKLQIPAVIHSTGCYALLDYIDGAPIGSWNLRTMTIESRHHLLDGLAVFLFKLWTCPAPVNESGVSMAATSTYRDWLLEEVNKAICRALRSEGWGDPVHLLRRRALIDEMLPSQGSVGMAIKHGDLNALNVLVNDDGLTGVIDWDTASFVPTAAAVHHPIFMADIPGFRNDAVPEYRNFAADREYLVNAIRDLPGETGILANLLASSWERQFFELSLRNKRINEEYIRLKLGGWEYDKKLLCDQLDDFVFANKAVGNDAAFEKLRRQLSLVSDASIT